MGKRIRPREIHVRGRNPFKIGHSGWKEPVGGLTHLPGGAKMVLGVSGGFGIRSRFLFPKMVQLALLASCLQVAGGTARAQGFSVTEFHYQGGGALRPHRVSPDGFQHVMTFQHASAWNYGENFLFVDMQCCAGAVANRDVYLEWYPYVSLGAVTGRNISWGFIRDVGPLGGLSWGAQSRILKITPGFRFQLDLPGFAFANIDYQYQMDRSQGLAAGGAPKEGNSHTFDFNWGLPFEIGGGAFSFEGHGEWQSSRANEFGGRFPYWILLQPQFRFDVGNALFSQPGRFFAGIEFQVWTNKFGFRDADEVLPQLLAVFRF